MVVSCSMGRKHKLMHSSLGIDFNGRAVHENP